MEQTFLCVFGFSRSARAGAASRVHVVLGPNLFARAARAPQRDGAAELFSERGRADGENTARVRRRRAAEGGPAPAAAARRHQDAAPAAVPQGAAALPVDAREAQGGPDARAVHRRGRGGGKGRPVAVVVFPPNREAGTTRATSTARSTRRRGSTRRCSATARCSARPRRAAAPPPASRARSACGPRATASTRRRARSPSALRTGCRLPL
mgnify:CR=1 FL=1